MIRKIGLLFSSFLLLIIIFQNLSPVKFNFLFWSFETSLALLLIITLILTVIFSLLLIIPSNIRKLILNRDKKPDKI